MFEVLVKEEEKRLLNENLKDFRANIENKDFTFKIKSYCDKFGFNFDEVKQEAKTNDLVASFFIKDPARQNFTEKLVSKLLNTAILPQQGKNCIRFTENGEITNKKTTNVSKSADFYINDTYFTQKYTRGEGGAQDNQYNDVVDFLIKGSIKHKVGAIIDGSYWDSHREELKNYFKDNSNVSIYSMDDLWSDNN